MLPMGRGCEPLADLSEFVVTKKCYVRERIEVNEWIRKMFGHSYPYDLIQVDYPDGSDEGVATINQAEPDDYDIYWDGGEIVWKK